MQFNRSLIWPVIIAFSVVLFTSVFAGAMVFMRSAAPYDEAMEKARANPDVVSVTGTPIEGSWIITGSAGSGPGGTNVDAKWTIDGPDGEGTLWVEAYDSNGEWVFQSLVFEFDDGAEIDVLR